MRKSPPRQTVRKSRSKPSSVDDQLADHLEQAEHHLIGAVNLFAEHKKLDRRVGYFTRLVQAQESTTNLYREELVRIRGPQRPKRRRK